MGSVGVLLHFKGVVLDVVDGGQDDPLAILLDPGECGFHPESNETQHSVLQPATKPRWSCFAGW